MRQLSMECFVCGHDVTSSPTTVTDDTTGLGPYCDDCWDDIVLSAPVDTETDDLLEDIYDDEDVALLDCRLCAGAGVLCRDCSRNKYACDCAHPTPVICSRCDGEREVLTHVDECEECGGHGRVCNLCRTTLDECECTVPAPADCGGCSGEGVIERQEDAAEINKAADEELVTDDISRGDLDSAPRAVRRQ